ncbi:MAG TPA: radical SAM protein [Terracidiphilus sp.]|nr:radical SAM protein [Terracidiphilus sp.]
MRTSNKIVFFFPSFASSEATAPLGILAVATPLLRAGFEIVIIDSTITPNFKERVLTEIQDALCLGISLVTGPMIRETVEIARAVKAWNPEFPIVLGGWHPSLLPKQTLEAPYIDYIVRGQGEDSFLELVQHLRAGSAPDFVAGIGFKRDGKLVMAPERPLRPLVEMPPKAYHLADFDAYERKCGRRWAMYTSSLACPFNCAYCTNSGVYGRKWNALGPEQFVEETVDLSRRYALEMIWVVDDNFLVDMDRARGIAEGLVRENSHFVWSIQATSNVVARLTPEDLRLLRRAGLHQICQGVDSGSPAVLKAMHKDWQDFDSIYESAARCLEAGIRPSFNIIFAFPGEGRKERRETIDFMMSVCRRFPGAEFWTNIFTPYPGSPIFSKVEELGIEVPKSLEAWADYFPRYTKLPWLNGKEHNRLQVTRDYLRIAFDRIPIGADRRGNITKLVQKCISLPARWRLDHDMYKAPVELWLNNKLKDHTAMKPAVDAKRLARTPAEAAC